LIVQLISLSIKYFSICSCQKPLEFMRTKFSSVFPFLLELLNDATLELTTIIAFFLQNNIYELPIVRTKYLASKNKTVKHEQAVDFILVVRIGNDA